MQTPDTAATPRPKRRMRKRPSGAHKLLTLLLYGRFSFYRKLDSGAFQIISCRSMGSTLGVPSLQIKDWLRWLEDQGYIESLALSPNRRSAQFRIRRPPNAY